MAHSIFWLILIAIFLFLEIMTLGMITIWLAAGALAAFILSILFDNLFIEIIVFLLMSIALFSFVRPLTVKYMNPKRIKTNYQGVIGQLATVVVTIDNHKSTGKVSVEGQEWSAKSLDGMVIDTGTRVKVQGISGVKLMVNKYYKK